MLAAVAGERPAAWQVSSPLEPNRILDLFSAGIDRNFLYLNGGNGTFQEAANRVGLEVTPYVGKAGNFPY